MANLLTVSQVSELTTLKPATIYCYVAKRQIPFIKLGARVVFDLEEIKAWINARRVAPIG